MSTTESHPDLAAYLAAERAQVDRALARLLDVLLADAPQSIAEPIRYAVGAGGKRLRPILCVSAYRAVRDRRQGRPDPKGAIYDVACALEFVHTYSLVHDDLPCMDDDDLRRGISTTHRVFGVPAAVAAGAALIPLAFRALDVGAAGLDLRASRRAAIATELAQAAGGGAMVGGQELDLLAEGRPVLIEELEEIHQRKTGALLAAAPRLGGLAASADEASLKALGIYGRSLGLAFQITDDVLDVTGTAETLGKTAQRDESLAKATYPALMGLPEAKRKAKAQSEAAVAALSRSGLATPELVALARYAVERDR